MSTKSNSKSNKDESKRDFLIVSTYAMAGVGAASFAWPLIDQMNPAADTLALASTEIDLSSLEEGQAITVQWRGKPVFVRHRTAEEIKKAREALEEMRDPELDEERVSNEKYIVLVGVCTHLGVCLSDKNLVMLKGNMVVGFAHVMVLIMIIQAELEKAPHQLI